MGEPLASVVVPSRAGARRLPRLLGTLAAQDYPRVEVVVVVDGDVDGSAHLVAAWRDRLNVRAVVLPENRGRVSALNAGHEAARGEVLIRCDDDLELGPRHVSGHVRHHQLARPVGVIGLCRNVFPGTAFARVYGEPRERTFRSAAYACRPDVRWRLWGGNVSVTRTTWETVGAYDTAYRAYGFEDVDYGYRLRLAGVETVVDPAVEALHHGASTTTEVRARRAFLSGAARATFDAKFGGGVLGGPGEPSGLWRRAVDATGRHLDEQDVERLARAADRVIGGLPPYLAEKLVAFTVESAGVAGQGHRGGLDTSV